MVDILVGALLGALTDILVGTLLGALLPMGIPRSSMAWRKASKPSGVNWMAPA